ncbi:MAG: DNA polymerase III subunit delta [Bdellovibrionales bacterium]|nr:DNA polymerase III subunit delta [Bdellovibrionales bacterium]
MNIEVLRKNIEKNEFSPLYLFSGEESFLIEESLKSLIHAAVPEALREFNLDIFSASDFNPGRVMDATGMLPMMAERRMVVLKDVDDLKAKDFESLMPLIDQGGFSSSILVMTAVKADMRLKFFKKFSEVGAVVKFDRPFENQMGRWVEYFAQKQGKQIDPDATALLVEYVGTSLSEMDLEMQKLAQYAGERARIAVADVQAVSTRVRVESVFALTEAIGTNNREAAFICLAQLLDQGENPVGILSLITRHIRILKFVKDAQTDNLTSAQMSSRVGVPPFFLKEYTQQTRFWSQNKIANAFQLCVATDRALKSSPVSSHIWLENFVLKTCQ